MRRREFITLLGGAALTWPLVARAQQAGKIPRVAILGPDRAAPATNSYYAAFMRNWKSMVFVKDKTLSLNIGPSTIRAAPLLARPN